MSAKLQITTRVRRLLDYIEDIEKGLIQIPGFQRDFIWTNSDKLELFNSLKKGYPIGSILLWKPTQSFGGETNIIGPYTVPNKVDSYFYVLDGFQRISTLFGCLINPNKTTLICDQKIWEKEFQICYDLEKEEFILPRSKKLEIYQIPVYKLIDPRESFNFQRSLFSENDELIDKYLSRFEEIGNTLLSFSLPSIDINGGEIDEAIDIFWRLNSKGSTISPDWIVSAKTFDEDFRLGSQIDNLLEELNLFNFGGIKRDLILQCIQSSFGKIYFEMKIEEVVARPDFKENTIQTIVSIKKAVKFLFEELLVIDSKLLPANIQLIFITEFFNQIKNPSLDQLEALKIWFWKTTYSNYFTVFSPSKRKEAFVEFLKYLNGEISNPFYNDRPAIKFQTGDFPTKIFFGSVRSKALILFLLNSSNKFNSVKQEEVEGLNLSYLFYDQRNEKGDFAPESVVPNINWLEGDFEKTKDMSFLLRNEHSDILDKYFLSKEMIDLYNKEDYSNIISKRKDLIMEAERKFVESYDMIYGEFEVVED